MATPVPESDAGDPAEQPLLLAAEVGGWPGLGGDVRVELGHRRTVLVGKNGAGKSLLVEGVARAAVAAIWGPQLSAPRPLNFRCAVQLSGDRSLGYEYGARTSDSDEEGEGPPQREWYERCWDLANDEDIWQIQRSKLVIGAGEPVPFMPGVGLLALQDSAAEPPAEVALIGALLAGVQSVAAGLPRKDGVREEVLVSSTGAKGRVRRWQRPGADRLHRLAYSITNLWERSPEHYEEFRQILRDLDVVREVAVKVYKDPAPDRETDQRQDFAAVLFDGINLGYQSDGTLRVAEIVWKLLQPGVRCLLIEEPETAVHPGLLARLLALLDAYSLDRQIVVSTHSPEVVDWCSPQDLRLVVRQDGVTQAHALDPADMASVMRHLHGSLSDFVYRRQRT